MTPDSHTMFIGDSAQSSTYTVAVDQTVTPNGQKVTGTITIANSTSKTAIIANVIDTITPGNIPVAVNCGVTFPYTLLAGQTLNCSYTQTLTSAFSGQNEVIVLPGNGSQLFGGRATANFSFDANTPKETTGYSTVDVVDSKQGTLQTDLNGDKTFTYDTNFGCPTDPAQYVNGKYEETYDNTAKIQKNTTVIDSDSASVKKTCYAPVVTKTAHPSITQTLGWTLDKQVNPTTLSMNVGESDTVHYTVTVGTEVINTNYAVDGTITVTNPHPSQAMTVTVADMLAGNIPVTVDCGGSSTLTVPANSSATCTYSTPLPNNDNRLNTVTATLNNIGFNGTAMVDFNGVVPTVVGPTPSPATVTDSNTPAGSPWQTSGPQTWSYNETLTCSSNSNDYPGGHYSFQHPNIATIDNTDKSDTTNVTVNCYAPMVSKTAETAFTRVHQWSIDKQANIGLNDILLQVGQTYVFTYDITVNMTGYQDKEVTVHGHINVINPNPTKSMTVSVADNLPGATLMTLDCGGTLTIPASSSALCQYDATLPDNSTGALTNTAQVTLNGVQFSAQTAVIFGAPAQEKDKCVTVTDQIADNAPWTAAIDTVMKTLDSNTCVTDVLPKTFSYPLTVGPYTVDTASGCKLPESPADYIDNTATVTTHDNNVSSTAEEHVPICVPKAGGCTLTQGYWKTHSYLGKAPESQGWMVFAPTNVAGVVDSSQIVNLASKLFFKSNNQTYYQVLWTAPAGNAYYILARQWIAAYLNWINGASMPTMVSSAFNSAWTLLATYTPAQVGKGGLIANQAKAYAATLDSYNQGLIGPGHCSDDSILFGGNN